MEGEDLEMLGGKHRASFQEKTSCSVEGVCKKEKRKKGRSVSVCFLGERLLMVELECAVRACHLNNQPCISLRD